MKSPVAVAKLRRALFGLLLCLPATGAHAGPLDVLSIRAGGYATHFGTTLRVDDPRGRRGSDIDFDRELGLEKNNVIESLGLAWRPASRHEFGVSYFHQSLTGERRLDRTLIFRDQELELDALVRTSLTLESFEFHYTWWAEVRDDWALGFRFGYLDYRLATRLEMLAADDGEPQGSGIRVTADLTVPAPNFGVDLRMQVSDHWRFNTSLGWLEADLEHVSPLITSLRLGVEYLAWENFGLWADFGLNRVAGSYHRDMLTGRLEIREGGLRLGITYRL